MKPLLLGVAGAICVAATLSAQGLARSPAPPSGAAGNNAQLEMLAKKIDEQNAKIDMLSQQILKLQQQLANSRPGIMIGETPTPPASTAAAAPAPAASSSSATAAAASPAGNSHTVARGETLTSIAKAYGVSVTDLQKYNHIENPLKLQAGQTLMIPSANSPAPSPPD